MKMVYTCICRRGFKSVCVCGGGEGLRERPFIENGVGALGADPK